MIIPSTKYAGQVATDLTNYPQGKARNITVAGDGTGTPLEQDWMNDWFGFQQALVLAAGITPSGTPDTALVSQALKAIQYQCRAQERAVYTVDAVTTTVNAAYTLTLVSQFGGFTYSSGQVQVPDAGLYMVTLSGSIRENATANPQACAAALGVNGSTTDVYQAFRYSATPSEAQLIYGQTVKSIATPSGQKLSVIATSATAFFTSNITHGATLVIERIN